MADENRNSKLTLELAKDGEQVHLHRVDLQERLSGHFRATVLFETLTEIEKLMPNLGKTATVELISENEHARYISGVVADIQKVELGTHAPTYQATIVPQLFFHQQGRNFRIYQDYTISRIIDDVLKRNNVSYRISSANTFDETRSYCVQYGESDYDFISRLMEEYGYYYYYEFDKNVHTLVITPSVNGAKTYDFSFEYSPTASEVSRADGQEGEFNEEKTFFQTFTPFVATGSESKVVLRDYDFIQSGTKIEGEFGNKTGHEQEIIEVYDWPARSYTSSLAASLAEIQLQSRQAERKCYDLESQWPGIVPGRVMKLKFDPTWGSELGSYAGDYLVVAAHTTTATETYRSGMDGGQTRVRATLIPRDVPFKARARTRKPLATGPQSAIVTGPAGEEIHVDEFARVKVRFLWDRSGEMRDESSCWVRVSQTGGLGNMIIPRVGMEVLVEFINGDPDRPIIVGRVYNDAHMPYYALPNHKTRQVWKSKTYKRDMPPASTNDEAGTQDWGPRKSNEIRFEDLADEEEIYIHAEKDFNIRVRNNMDEIVNNDHLFLVKHDQTGTVRHDQTLTVENNRTITVERNQTEHIKQKQNVTADQEMKMICGESSITLLPGSIEIKSPMITIDGTTQVDIKTLTGNFKCTAMLTLKGSMVMIN